MAHTDYTDYLQPGYPQEKKSERTTGNVYFYRAPDSVYAATPPLIGEAWADSRPVADISAGKVTLSGYRDITITTAVTYAPSTPITTVEEGDPRYELRWQANDLPLLQHPAFLPGGASDLTAAASGSPSRAHLADVLGWEAETDMSLKSGYSGSSRVRSYKLRDSNGNAYGSTINLGGGALAYAKLRELGFESYTVHCPLWVKISRYRGTETPGVGSIGQYVSAADLGTDEGLPADIVSEGWQFIKVQDDAVRAGVSLLWERTEAWQGFRKVYYDVDELNPAANTLP